MALHLHINVGPYHSSDLLTAHGVAHLVVHGTSGSISYETIPHVRLESSGDVLSTVDLAQRRDGPRWISELDDDDERYANAGTSYGPVSVSLCLSVTSQSAFETAKGIKLVFGL